MKILNLTQHNASPEEEFAGVCEPSNKRLVQTLLTFTELPSRELLFERAQILAELAVDNEATHAMIDGAPYFMVHLARALNDYGVRPIFSFTKRETEEARAPDGAIIARVVYNHHGWIDGV